MRRKFVLLILSLVLLLNCLAVGTIAASVETGTDIIEFDDGSYLEVIVKKSLGRATDSVTGYKIYRYRDASDNIEWEAELTATYTYNGTTSTCTGANCSVTISDSKWYVVSNSTTRSANTATTLLTMGKKFLGITVGKPEYTITLTCDKDGNLS